MKRNRRGGHRVCGLSPGADLDQRAGVAVEDDEHAAPVMKAAAAMHETIGSFVVTISPSFRRPRSKAGAKRWRRIRVLYRGSKRAGRGAHAMIVASARRPLVDSLLALGSPLCCWFLTRSWSFSGNPLVGSDQLNVKVADHAIAPDNPSQ